MFSISVFRTSSGCFSDTTMTGFSSVTGTTGISSDTGLFTSISLLDADNGSLNGSTDFFRFFFRDFDLTFFLIGSRDFDRSTTSSIKAFFSQLSLFH